MDFSSIAATRSRRSASFIEFSRARSSPLACSRRARKISSVDAASPGPRSHVSLSDSFAALDIARAEALVRRASYSVSLARSLAE